jgi:hypothetical protein
MTDSNTNSSRPLAAVVTAVLGTKILLFAAAFAWVAVYSHLVHTGETEAYYQAHAQRSSPVVAVVVGLPLYFFVARRLASRFGRSSGYSPVAWFWLGGLAIDLPIVLLVSGAADLLTCLAAQACYLIATGAGARSIRAREPAPVDAPR